MDERKIHLIFGKRGSGKSYLARHLIKNEPRLIVYDTLHEAQVGVVCKTEAEFYELWKRSYRRGFKLVYQPTDPQAEFGKIADLIWKLGNLCFYVEEIDSFGSAHKIQPEFMNIIQRGRHKNIKLVGVTQRPFGIHRLLTSQAKEIYIFNTNEPRDRDYLRALLGSEIDGKLDQLKGFEYVKWQDGNSALEIGRAP